ncbi:MAG: L,D-transpeptidase family protein [Sediminibacterium sp.]|nr:L,D-transpeptidase family protein [Sediminibacterium sp.]MDP1812162.1 L,D-transpeptidase family protein [Sediminibacterium sp.]MDP3127080.1 L,D-transpeptidase family protein [Sediminibacterium sp.]
MKRRILEKVIALLLAGLWSFAAFSQITPERLRQFISDTKLIGKTGIRHTSQVKEFYTRLNYQTAWLLEENQPNLTIFIQARTLSGELGLTEKDYQFNYPADNSSHTVRLQNSNDSLTAEIRMTDVAIHFYNDIAYGNTKPVLGYDGLKQKQGYRNIPALLAEYISGKKLYLLIPDLLPALPEIKAIENKIQGFRKILSEPGFREVLISSGKISTPNIPLVSKLRQLGIIDTGNKHLSDSLLKLQLKEVQKQFNLQADGLLGSNTLRQLNIPLSVRVKQLNLSVNYYRWLYSLTQNRAVIVVNIPAAFLKVYRDKEIILAMRMIVGKKSTPTPTLASVVEEVILYPYWHVPYSIATKELLPSIRRNPGYINSGNFQVLNSAGNIVNPYSVNWYALSKDYFPYTIRQSTGCDNSLGLLKLNFINPYGVYLHDTPAKSLFTLSERFFSHGCMRMEKPIELGHLILKNNPIAIDTLEQKGCLRNQSPITVHADEHMPVIVWYNPVGLDSNGRVVFYEDVYGKFSWMKKK